MEVDSLKLNELESFSELGERNALRIPQHQNPSQGTQGVIASGLKTLPMSVN